MKKEVNPNQDHQPTALQREGGSFRSKKRRRFLVVLPLLTLPFLTLAFWAMGGGKGGGSSTTIPAGLNTDLPRAALKQEKGDKLSFYEWAEAAEKKRKEAILNDPYFKDTSRESSLSSYHFLEDSFTRNPATVQPALEPFSKPPDEWSMQGREPLETPEQKILRRLEQLDKEIREPAVAVKEPLLYDQDQAGNNAFSENVDRLGQMMTMMKGEEEDPEMQKLQAVLERIIDIQHPERVRQSLAEQTDKETTVYRVSPNEQVYSDTGFYGGQTEAIGREQANTILAVVHGTQVLAEGAVIKLRLLQEVRVDGVVIPKGTFVAGLVHLNGERLEVELNAIRAGTSIYPVSLEVFDLDGWRGIYVPGSIGREVAQSSGEGAVQRFDIASLDPSFKAQASAAGIGAAKSFLSKKLKQVKVTVKSGYQVLLKQKQ